jgi:hypothetical protein
LNGNYAQTTKRHSGSIPLKSIGNPIYGLDVNLYDDPNQDQRQAGLSVAFNGWLYACYTLSDGGFVVVKSTDNGVTWDGWESVIWSGYFFPKLDIVVTGTTVSDLKVWVAYTCYDLSNTTNWFAGLEDLDGDLNYLGYTDLDNISSSYGIYDIAIASDYRNPGQNCNPFSLGILYSKYGSPSDSVIFYCSTDGGASFGYRNTVSTTSSFFNKVALSYGKGLTQSTGRYFAAWEVKQNNSDWDGNIYTSYTNPFTYSDFTPQENLDSLEGDGGMARNPSISTQFSDVNNSSAGMTEIVLFDVDYFGNGTDFDLVGMYNVNAASSSSNWVSFHIDNTSDNTIQSDINFSPTNNNFLVTYFDSTTQKLPTLWENFNMSNPSSWNVSTNGYNDNPGLTVPYPKIEINPALSKTANVWIQDRTNGNGEALFDAQYSNFDGVKENPKDNAVTLVGVRPNPCNESTSIGFELKQPENVTITLYDIYGKPKQVITDKPYNAGKFDVKVDLSELAAGSYYFTFKAGDFVSSGKIIVIR